MKLTYLLPLLGLSILSGCAAQTSNEGDQGASADEAVATGVTPGTFRLYDQPGHVPSGCDIYTKLELANDGGAKATLSEQVGGMCMIAVLPNLRSFHLHQTGDGCGSKIYEGKRTTADGVDSIKITDNRTRVCMDMVAAAIVVEETTPGFPGPITTTKYSMPDAPAPEQVTVEGDLFHSFGIGGENTGTSINTGKEVYELVLDASEAKEFVDGKHARVKGTKTLLSGVETHDRPAIDVTDILVCPNPGWIDCMPGPGRANPLCASDARSWISASCPGVGFAD